MRNTVSRQICAQFCSAALVAATLTPSNAYAWGHDGHRVIGLLVGKLIHNTSTEARVQALLSGPTLPSHPSEFASLASSLKERSRFADLYRDSDRNTTQERYLATREWHFIDTPVSDNHSIDNFAASFATLCPDPTLSGVAFQGPAQDCVVDKIEQFRNELCSPPSADEQVLALEFLLHLVGDVHQPMHAAEHNHDRGGNTVHFGMGDNLHAYWDSNTVMRLGSTPELIADDLFHSMPANAVNAWYGDGPKQWAHDSYRLARTVAYNLPANNANARNKYATKATGIARKQLQLAAARLAHILIECLH